jgi:hypothetical protein
MVLSLRNVRQWNGRLSNPGTWGLLRSSRTKLAVVSLVAIGQLAAEAIDEFGNQSRPFANVLELMI